MKTFTYLALIGALSSAQAVSLHQPKNTVQAHAHQLSQTTIVAPPKSQMPKQMVQIKSKSKQKNKDDKDEESVVQKNDDKKVDDKPVVKDDKKDEKKVEDDDKAPAKDVKKDDKKDEIVKDDDKAPAKDDKKNEKAKDDKAPAKDDKKDEKAKDDDKPVVKDDKKVDTKKDDDDKDVKKDSGAKKSAKEAEKEEEESDEKHVEGFEGYTQFDKDFLATHNKMRTNPQSLIPELEKMAQSFDGMGRMIMMNGIKTKLMTQEGAAPVKELIDFLKKQSPMGPLKFAKDLTSYSCKHVDDQGKTSQTGHSASDGTSFGERIAKLMNPSVVIGENISYGSHYGHDAALQLAIDDGVPSRGHRTNIFKEEYTEIGSCEGTHEGYRNMAVGIYRGPQKNSKDSGSGSGSKEKDKNLVGKETPEQKEQSENDIKADCALKATVDKKDDDHAVDPETKEKIVVLTLEVGSVKSRLERAGVPPATQREIYKILDIPWNDKDEEWFQNMPHKYQDMWHGRKPGETAELEKAKGHAKPKESEEKKEEPKEKDEEKSSKDGKGELPVSEDEQKVFKKDHDKDGTPKESDEKKADKQKADEKKDDDKKVDDKADDGKSDDKKKEIDVKAQDEKKPDEKKGDEKKVDEKKVDEKKIDEKKVDEKKPAEKDDKPAKDEEDKAADEKKKAAELDKDKKK